MMMMVVVERLFNGKLKHRDLRSGLGWDASLTRPVTSVSRSGLYPVGQRVLKAGKTQAWDLAGCQACRNQIGDEGGARKPAWLREHRQTGR